MVLGYWVQLIADGDEIAARPMLGLSSAVEAVGVYAQSLVEESEGAWTGGAIRVWDKDRGRENAAIFDVQALFVPATDEDAQDGDMDCELEIIERV